MRRLLGVLFGIAAYALVSTSAAYAGPTWCEEDPVFEVEGSLVDVTTGFDWADLPNATSVTFELEVPSNVSAVEVTIPALIPITTRISKVLPPWSGGDIPVNVLVTVTGTKHFDISTRIVGTYGELASWTPGTSNKTQRISFGLRHY